MGMPSPEEQPGAAAGGLPRAPGRAPARRRRASAGRDVLAWVRLAIFLCGAAASWLALISQTVRLALAAAPGGGLRRRDRPPRPGDPPPDPRRAGGGLLRARPGAVGGSLGRAGERRRAVSRRGPPLRRRPGPLRPGLVVRADLRGADRPGGADPGPLAVRAGPARGGSGAAAGRGRIALAPRPPRGSGLAGRGGPRPGRCRRPPGLGRGAAGTAPGLGRVARRRDRRGERGHAAGLDGHARGADPVPPLRRLRARAGRLPAPQRRSRAARGGTPRARPGTARPGPPPARARAVPLTLAGPAAGRAGDRRPPAVEAHRSTGPAGPDQRLAPQHALRADRGAAPAGHPARLRHRALARVSGRPSAPLARRRGRDRGALLAWPATPTSTPTTRSPSSSRKDPRFEARGLGHPLLPGDALRAQRRPPRGRAAPAGRQRLQHVRQEHAAAHGRRQHRAGPRRRPGAAPRRCGCRPLPVGASMRIQDSLAGGHVALLRRDQAAASARGSRDRRDDRCSFSSTRSSTAPTPTTAESAPRRWCAGSWSAARSGLVTTHDLALRRSRRARHHAARERPLRGSDRGREDQLRLHACAPASCGRATPCELMRSIGLDV